MEVLDQVLAYLGSINPVLLGSVAVFLEFALRLFPSQKPLSIAQLIAKAARGLGLVFTKVADILDKVLPQNVAPKE